MARYREKSPEDKAWNRTRRHITEQLDSAIRDAREEVLDILLTDAFREYVAAVTTGEIQEVEAKYSNLTKAIVAEIVPEPGKIVKPHAPVDE